LTRRAALPLLFAIPAVALLGLVNLRAHRPGDLDTTIAQLRFLQHALADDAAERMQRIFPEGYVFTWALYGLASVQVASQLSATGSERAHHLEQARRAIEEIRSDPARSTFSRDLDPPYGAFYSAWSLYLLAEYIRASEPDRVPAGLLRSFEEDCARFAEALRRSHTPFLRSYSRSAWPADTAVGVAALGIHDDTLSPEYSATIESWVSEARARLDDDWAALSHSAHPETGAPIGGVRGSSLALMSRVLIDAAPTFAAEQFSALRHHFVDYWLGVPGIREYPHGVAGNGDIDSGPIVFGYSGPAVVVGAAAARVHGDGALARVLLGVVEVAGMPIQLGRQRRYAGGFLPVGDAFIAWSRSSPLGSRTGKQSWEPLIPTWWANPAHAVSVIVGAAVLLAASLSGWRRRSR